MIRRMIAIDEEKCNGCGLCADACHEGAIGIVAGKAKLLREDFCDGLGDCLPACPMKAISFREREAPAYNEAAVLAAKKAKESPPAQSPGIDCGNAPHDRHREEAYVPCELTNFPIQIKLAPPNAPYYDGADLLIAADCTAYSYGNFHQDFMHNRVTLIGCPKLDMVDYSEKLTEILKLNDIRSLTVIRMTVPCCGGLPFAVRRAIEKAGKDIPFQTVTIRPDGYIVG